MCCIFAVLGVFSTERAPKMLKNEVLDVQKFDGTAEKEPSQVSDFALSAVGFR